MNVDEIVTPTLFHASDVPALRMLRPRPSKLFKRDVVFAATHPEIAVSMAGHWTDEDFALGRTLGQDDDPEATPYVMRELRKGAFNEFFGTLVVYVYRLDDRSFHREDQIQDFERISFNPVAPKGIEEVNSPLRYMSRSKMVRLVGYEGTSD